MSLVIPQMLSNQKLVDLEGLCGRLVLKHKDPTLGTTFPPTYQNITFIQASKTSELRTKCKFLSDPDISSEEIFSSQLNNLEEDLFEFDIGSPVSDASSDLNSELDINTVINVIEEEEEVLSDDGERVSVSSDNSVDCSHSRDCGGGDGFKTIFAPTSGIRSENISLIDESGLFEGELVDPSDWKDDYTNSISTAAILFEDNFLEDQNLERATATSTSHSFHNLKEANADVECVTSQDLDSGISEEDQSDQIKSTTVEPTVETTVEVSNPTPDPEKVVIHPNLVVSTHKLNTLLEQLEVDKLDTDKDTSHSEDDALCSPTTLHHKDSVYERPKLRKTTSLRSGRTPPTSPGCRKIVRFADILGLDLSEVKVFSDEIPRIPKEAFEDLDVNISEFDVGSPGRVGTSLPSTSTSLVPMFNQPGEAPNFIETVLERKVCLENAVMESPAVIAGVVRVLNISFHKTVTVRWTDNNWATLKETDCKFMQGSSWGNMDKFSFKLVTDTLAVGSRLQFCVKYDCAGEHWDSNGGNNYVFQAFLNSTRSPTAKTHPTGSRNTSQPFYQAHLFPPLHVEELLGRFM